MKLGQRMSLGQLEEMHQLALEGKNALQISRSMDVSPTTVREYMKKWGLDDKGGKKQGKYPPQLIAEWDRLHKRYGKNV